MVNEDCERFPIIPLPCFNPTMMNFNNFELTATGGDQYNFIEPQMLCSGNISSIQYCYVAASQSNGQQNIFQLLIIKQLVKITLLIMILLLTVVLLNAGTSHLQQSFFVVA